MKNWLFRMGFDLCQAAEAIVGLATLSYRRPMLSLRYTGWFYRRYGLPT